MNTGTKIHLLLRLVHTCDISISINISISIRKRSVNQSNISISIRKRKLFLFLMLMLMSRNRKCEPDNISISITKQQYLMSAEIQANIVPNPVLINSFNMVSSSSNTLYYNEQLAEAVRINYLNYLK